MINKTVGVVMGALMMISAVVLLAIDHSLVFPCFVLGAIGYFAMADGMSVHQENKDEQTLTPRRPLRPLPPPYSGYRALPRSRTTPDKRQPPPAPPRGHSRSPRPGA